MKYVSLAGDVYIDRLELGKLGPTFLRHLAVKILELSPQAQRQSKGHIGHLPRGLNFISLLVKADNQCTQTFISFSAAMLGY